MHFLIQMCIARVKKVARFKCWLQLKILLSHFTFARWSHITTRCTGTGKVVLKEQTNKSFFHDSCLLRNWTRVGLTDHRLFVLVFSFIYFLVTSICGARPGTDKEGKKPIGLRTHAVITFYVFSARENRRARVNLEFSPLGLHVRSHAGSVYIRCCCQDPTE